MHAAAPLLEALRGQLIVSVQADEGEPLAEPGILAALAASARLGGAAGFRLAGADNIQAVRQRVPGVPVIAITKPPRVLPDAPHRVFITPTLADLDALAPTGAEIIATDASGRPRPDGASLAEWVAHARRVAPHALLMADIATETEGLAAVALGFDVVGTTLAGYTAETQAQAGDGPDFELLSALTRQLACPVILEGRVWTPEHVAEGFRRGAWAVVVGSAVTRPHTITRRLAQGLPKPGG